MELILVVVLIGILSAFAMPRFFDKNVFLERGFHDEVVAALRYAQKLAVATHCPVQMKIDTNGYRLRRPTDRGQCDAALADVDWDPVIDPAGGGNLEGTTPSGISSFTTAPTVTFTAAGTTEEADQTLTIGSRSIKVWQATGYVERL